MSVLLLSLGAIRKIVLDRLHDLDLETVNCPLGTEENDNHVPILVSKQISSKDRVIVYFGERNADLGILSWRVIGEEGVNHGSLVDFVKAALTGPAPTAKDTAPGIIIANPCQLLWYRGGSRAVSQLEWLEGLPKPSAVHEAMRIDPVKNTIPGNKDYREHVHY
jgi:hypothetical protein